MALSVKRLLKNLRTSPSELDVTRLRQFCAELPGMTAISDVRARQEAAVVGEISSLRIVPRAGSPSLEATITDGSGTIVAVWMGRRQIAGISPGRRLVVIGRANPGTHGNRLYFYNPRYELLEGERH
ncbi:MAG: OB-fold nucleic acid binding domain-containing protein [Acidimicrobiia bacterium]|nr:OB-fold nucleic acid binding domain-containing protein [Acidimicrobiia bacterium]